MAMFVGEYHHTIDEKGRITIPAKYRGDFESGLFVTCGLDQCLWVFTRDEWERFSEKIASLPMGQTNTRMLTRFFFSQATDAIPDRQGRILLPENLRRFIGVSEGAVITGANNKVEIWHPDRWRQLYAEQQANLTEMADALTAFGL